ncbi:MAG: hypothetical protein WC709_11585 [Thermoleophilia bacterium]
MLCSLTTKLGQDDLGQIEALEKELGVPVLAFSCHAADPAAIGEAQVARLRELESRLGVSLVAVKH